MSPKRKASVSEFGQYTPASLQQAEQRAKLEENGNAFPFDKEFEPVLNGDFDTLPVIDTVRADQIFPDALQPRPSPLPASIRGRFRRYQVDAFQAARDWLKLGEEDAIIAHDVRRYLSMGENMSTNGQINPITGRWEQAVIRGKEKRIFRIETGEQRFWSAVLYHTSKKLPPEELTMRVSVVPNASAPTEIATIRRQISENRKNMQLTEVLQAREIARMLLAAITEKTGQEFPVDERDEYDYFRAALRLGRVPHGVWDTVQEEFHLSQHRMRQSLEILRFPSRLLDLAHSARLSYRQLRAVLDLPEPLWEETILRAVHQSLAADEENSESSDATEESEETNASKTRRPKKLVDPVELAYRGVRRFYRSALKGIHANPLLFESVADNVIMDGYAEEVVDLMEDLIRAIRIRLDEEQSGR